jgi:hypothetical protein
MPLGLGDEIGLFASEAGGEGGVGGSGGGHGDLGPSPCSAEVGF